MKKINKEAVAALPSTSNSDLRGKFLNSNAEPKPIPFRFPGDGTELFFRPLSLAKQSKLTALLSAEEHGKAIAQIIIDTVMANGESLFAQTDFDYLCGCDMDGPIGQLGVAAMNLLNAGAEAVRTAADSAKKN